MGRFEDLTGQQFGRLTVVKKVKEKRRNRIYWECKCSCGNPNSVYTTTDKLKNGHTKSCGCSRKGNTHQRKVNQYNLTGEYGVGYTNNGEEFYFDLEDYDKIKNFCWCINGHGYIEARTNNGSQITMHRLLCHLSKEQIVDHINRKKFDNRKANLRPCKISENNRNNSLFSNNTSGIIGVSYYKQCHKWTARLSVNHKQIYLGLFISKDDAIKARLEAEAKYFGEFAPQKHLFEQYGIKEENT